MHRPTFPQDDPVLEPRRRAGLDRRDEVWAGGYHVVPEPTFTHNTFVFFLQRFLHETWAQHAHGRVARMNLAPPGGWPDRDYRVPDLILWRAGSDAQNHDTHFEGAPEAVIEVRSPGDETYAKLPFYAALGVPEVWVIHRDSRAPELFEPDNGTEVQATPECTGWLRGKATGLEMRAGRPGTLRLRLGGAPDTERELPEE